MIKTKVAKFYQENQNNQFNISVSLDRKDFNQLSIPKKLKLNSSEQFVYWKDYLVDYLVEYLHIQNFTKITYAYVINSLLAVDFTLNFQ